ncbi:diguanylate cyclase domain-containing protein [Achromobacter aloeverae]|uniref:Diguanylate cyclase n=1 Tax=Achromobacter aloeverae TaxID=1750518 RepID=A0A4Q1HDV7_9BURK|nr:diguanylate cyclase [Achromobacter aloeverae]RXN83222.1 diguanylate cyclase [Achromobacter aloeverae]
MTTPPTPSGPRLPTLRDALRRAQVSVTVIAVGLVGLVLTIMGLVALRAYAEHNTGLIARSMLYTVEASVVFHDAPAAQDALALIANTESVGTAIVFDSDGLVLAQWTRPRGAGFAWIQQPFERIFTPPPIVTPIVHRGNTVGTLLVTGHPGSVLAFLLKGVAGVLACLVASAMLARAIARRTFENIVEPLRNLARVAHAVRNERAFGVRLPPADIAELNALGEDFNALLDQLQAWQNQLQHENATLAHKAAHDSLTGLPNRAHFQERLERAIHDAGVLGQRVAVLFIDSDRFKEINDQQGHASGDAVLVHTAARVRNQLRETDLVARLGGDEFAVLLSPLRDIDTAHHLAGKILASMRDPIRLPGGTEAVSSLSIGIAVYPDHAKDARDLFEAADAAMYRAKRQGGDSQATAGTPPAPSPTYPKEIPS